MMKRVLLAALVAVTLLPGLGCGFRRGCSKCNSKADYTPPPANYCPPACP